MPDPTLRITLERVRFTPEGQGAGMGTARFRASVTVGGRTTPFGVPILSFNYAADPLVTLGWSAEVAVRGVDNVQWSLRCVDRSGTQLAEFSYKHTWPWRSIEKEILSTANMFLVFSVAPTGAQRAAYAPWGAFARQAGGSVRYNTVHGRREFRLEACPVLPVPADRDLPQRPAHIRAAANAVRSGRARVVTASDPKNIIANPPLIPRLGAPNLRLAATATNAELDAAAWANHRNAARLELTYYWPDTERFGDKDRRLVWRKIAGAGDVGFVKWSPTDPAGTEDRGLKVMVYGKRDGAVTLGVHFNGTLAASYRAVVGPLKRIPCRFNIRNGPPGPPADRFRYTPRSTPANVAAHREVANCFLRQVGVLLVPESPAPRDNQLSNGARRTDRAGIFRIRVHRTQTRGVSDAAAGRVLRLNSRANVMNFVYIHSADSASVAGAAIFWPNSKLGRNATVADAGTPSSSWIKPSGIRLDPAAGNVTMRLIEGWPPPVSHRHLFGMYVTNGTSADPSSEAGCLELGVVIAHEVGHMLNLGHRVEDITDAALQARWNAGTLVPAAGGRIARLRKDQGTLGANDGLWCDELWHPRLQNVMHWIAPAEFAQDFDLLQLQVVRQSPLLDLAL